MKEDRQVLPVRCRRCSANFDLWYDLQNEEKTSALHLPGLTKKMQQSLCWDCRQAIAWQLLKASSFAK